ncbi:hypothetical protein [Methylobacter sp.]|uniref:hypothetical protein n=1 Tax=Methylobacter sp. TaxID=2051955 RepID=UPI002487575B|nr:hypothetical protein [Methylobacter sp.]MDI1276709.1 hypothetical protein [Methylobacter sp.]MDI1357377.1 hypothetical protein [Methylobacter sp.]
MNTELKTAQRLLYEINQDAVHPINDSNHPAHAACVRAARELWRKVETQKALESGHGAFTSGKDGKVLI